MTPIFKTWVSTTLLVISVAALRCGIHSTNTNRINVYR